MCDSEEPCSTLYVGDLHFKVTEKILFQKFSEFGSITSIRVCRDNTTKMSLGYAYITFESRYEAKVAMETLNLSNINGKPCRIMWFEKDPSKRQSGIGNVIVKNLGKYVTVKDVNDAFSEFGKITSCKLKTDEYGTSKGCAYINFKKEIDAEAAIKSMNKTLFGDKVITVEKFFVKGSHGSDHLTNCYIKNCPLNVDDSLLRMIFEKYGNVNIAKIMLNEDGVSRGFGFVEFQDPRNAAEATRNLNGKVIQDRRILVYRVKQRKEAPNNVIMVNNLPLEFDEARLKAEFEVFGKVSSAKIIDNASNAASPKYCLVSFVDEDDARDAVQQMNGKPYSGVPLSVTFNMTKEPYQNPPPIIPQIPQFQPLVNFPQIRPQLVPPWSIQFWPRNYPFVAPMNNLIRVPLVAPYPGMVPNINVDQTNITKQLLGEKLYPVVRKYAAENAGQVTLRLLSLDNAQILSIIDNEDLIRSQVLKISEDIAKETNAKIDSVGGNTVTNFSADGAVDEGNKDDSQSSSGETSSESDSSSGDEETKESMMTLRENLRPLIARIAGNICADIETSILNEGNAQLLYMFENEDYLRMKIEEAKSEHGSQKCTLENCSSKILNVEPKDIEAKQLLGEKIYGMVVKYAGNMAGKVTGMLLEIGDDPVHDLLANEDALRRKVEEALSLIKESSNELCPDQSSTDGSTKVQRFMKGSSLMTRYPQMQSKINNCSVGQVCDALGAHHRNIRYYYGREGTSNTKHGYMKDIFTSGDKLDGDRKINIDGQKIELSKTGKFDSTLVMEAKQLLGEKIYPLVAKHAGDMAAKVTGMLLELDNVELLYMIECEDSLRLKINEAMSLINVHKTEPGSH